MNAKASTSTILLVDDDPAILMTVGDSLMGEGYTVIKAVSGVEALDRLSLFKVDLIVLDISMPDLGGLGFLRKTSLRADFNDIPVLIFTARSNLKELFESVGTAGFVPKNGAPDLLTSTIKNILNERETTWSNLYPHPVTLTS